MVICGNITSGHRRASRITPAGGSPWVSRWLILALIALGAFLRFYRLDVQSLWVDEVLTIGAAEIGGRFGVREFFGNVQGPLHALIVHLVARSFSSEFALRSISAVAGTALIPVTYLLGRLVADRRTGLVAAALVTVSPFAIWYSQELRNYSLLMVFSGIATLLAWRLVAGRGRSWTAYVVSIVLAIYCNLTAAFLALSHAAFAAPRALRDRSFVRGAALAFVAVVALAAPIGWGLSMWAQKAEVPERVTFVPSAEDADLRRGETTFSPVAVGYSVFAMGYGFSLGPGLRELHAADASQAVRAGILLTGPAAALLGVALLLGLASLGRRKRGLSFALLIMLVTLAAASALALLNVKPMNPRYLAAAFPVFVVTLAAGISSAPRVAGSLLGAGIVLFCGVSLGGYYFNPRYWKEDVRSAAYYVELHEEPGDVVLVPVVRDVFNHYYDGGAERVVFYPGQAGSADAVRDRLEREAGGARRLWYVESRPWEADPEGRISSYLRATASTVDMARFAGVSVVLYSMRPAGAGSPEAAQSATGPDARAPAAGMEGR